MNTDDKLDAITQDVDELKYVLSVLLEDFRLLLTSTPPNVQRMFQFRRVICGNLIIVYDPTLECYTVNDLPTPLPDILGFLEQQAPKLIEDVMALAPPKLKQV